MRQIKTLKKRGEFPFVYISEAKEVQKPLNEQFYIKDSWYKAIIQSAMEGFFLADKRHNILDVNDSYCSMVGYSRNELLSMNIKDIDIDLAESSDDVQIKIAQMHRADGSFFEAMHRCKSGQIIYLMVSYKYINIGADSLIFCFHRDITEQKKIYKQLKESEELYHSLIDLGGKVGEAVVMFKDTKTIKGKQIFTSDKWVDMTGYSRNELRKISIYNIVSSIEDDNNQAWLQPLIHNNDPISPVELHVQRKDGIKFPVELTTTSSIYHGERVYVAYIRDITERKKIENELKGYQLYLEELVNRRTDALEKANKELEILYKNEKECRIEIEEQTNIRTNFIKTLAHELKTPLTPMLGTGSILIDRSEEIGDETLLRMARNINRGAEHLNRRITDLMDYVSGVSDRIQLQYGEVDPVKLLSQTVTYVTPEAEIKRQSLLLHIKNHLPILYADEDRLRQVILNLLNNAMKFTPPEGHITVSADLMDSKLIVEVEDDGCGIDESEKEKIFQSEGKLETEVRKHDGFGIGLPLSKMLIELHGGKIWCESEKGHGSKFSFYIPVKSCEDGFK
jgi:PAS domain S-box-containing protein